MSDAEKLAEAGAKYLDDPLILRPHVGGDVLRSRPSGRLCWPRSFILRLMLICIILATIAGSILIIFTLHHSGALPWNHFHRRYASVAGSCRVFSSFPEIGVEERYLYEPNAITITHGPVAGYSAALTFHLLKEAISVVRTHGICYVYPLDPGIAGAVPVNESDIEQIKEALYSGRTQIKFPIGTRVFMISPDTNYRVQIEHPAAAANCSDVLIFRLIEIVLSEPGDQLEPCFISSLSTTTFSSVNAFYDVNTTPGPRGPAAAFSPVTCLKECTLEESRVNPEIPHPICRCPLRAFQPIALPQFNAGNSFQISDDQEVVNSAAEDASKENISPPESGGNALEDGEENEDIFDVNELDGDTLSRPQRSINTPHEMQGPVRIPLDCRSIDEVLESAVPNSQNHALSKLTIVKC